VLKKPPELDLGDLEKLARALIEKLPYIRSVWAAVSPVEGEYRLRDYVHLAGEYRSITLYREHGCVFEVDVRRVFITPRLSYEHARVASLVASGETVVNMYAGAGLFSIVMAKRAKPSRVYSIDINPDAYVFMVRNIVLNRVGSVVVPVLGDATRVITSMLTGVADRVLMPLPELALDHLPYALKALKEAGGFIHVYVHVGAGPGEDPLAKAASMVAARLKELGAAYRVRSARVVRMVGPRRYQVVVDVYARPSAHPPSS
jgi:tRNA (guanine37-N1)-methyltransferase